jgi:hypothetical protein
MSAGLNEYVSGRAGWLTSIPGDWNIRMECLLGSPLPEALHRLGWEVEPIGQSRQRLIESAITEKLTRTSSGAFEFATEGSTKPVALRITHAGPTQEELAAIKQAGIDERKIAVLPHKAKSVDEWLEQCAARSLRHPQDQGRRTQGTTLGLRSSAFVNRKLTGLGDVY